MSQQINLYEDRLRPRRELATGRNLGVCALALLVVLTLCSVWARIDATRSAEAAAVTQKQLADAQETLSALSKQVAQRKVSPVLEAELDHVKATLATRVEVMQLLDSGRLGNASGFSSFLAGFARLAHSDLWLTGFRIAGGGDDIEIRGRMLDPSRLPVYVQRLSSESVFQGRRFAALEMQSVDPEQAKAESFMPAQAVTYESRGQDVQRLPRYVEFVLRSSAAGAQGVKP